MPYPINTSFLNTGVVPRKQAVLTPWDEWASTTASYQGGASGVQGSADVFAPQSSGVETPLETSTSKTLANVLMATVLGVVGALAGGEVSWRNRPNLQKQIEDQQTSLQQSFQKIVTLPLSDQQRTDIVQQGGVLEVLHEVLPNNLSTNEPLSPFYNEAELLKILSHSEREVYKREINHSKPTQALINIRKYFIEQHNSIVQLLGVEKRLSQTLTNITPEEQAYWSEMHGKTVAPMQYVDETFLPNIFTWLRKKTMELKDIQALYPPSQLVEESNKAKVVAGVTGFVVSTLSLLALRVLNKPKQPTPKPTPLVHPVVPAPHLLRTHNSRASVNHSHKPKASDAPDNDDA